jgi:hypothetical protein
MRIAPGFFLQRIGAELEATMLDATCNLLDPEFRVEQRRASTESGLAVTSVAAARMFAIHCT